MQLITLLSVATAMVATTVARDSAAQLNAEVDMSQPHASVTNRCNYDVHLWSVLKGTGCPSDQAVVLKKGETYKENLYNSTDATGISIKMSSTSQCTKGSITQLEYFLSNTPGFEFDFLDMSYVDCEDNDCPTRQEGYYLQAGDQTAGYASSAGNTWCPILSCSDQASCSKMSYVLPDDVQTKTCDPKQNLNLYLCGGNAPTDDDSTPSEPSSSSTASTPTAKQTTLAKVPTSVVQKVQVAEVTPAPLVDTKNIPKILTVVEVVTAYQTIAAKRHEHAHAHARRHQPFNA